MTFVCQGHKKKAFCGVIYCSNRPWQQLDSMVITTTQAPKKRRGHSYSLDLQQEADGHSFTMGCNISNRVAVAQLSSEELQNSQGAKSQTKNDSSVGTEAFPSQDGAAWPTGPSKDGDKLEVETSEADSPEELPERFTSFQKSSNTQSTDAPLTSEFTSKSWPLKKTERQKPSDILEELRMQGIIKSQSTIARTGEVYENERDALEKTQKKPPVRLEKIQFGNKEVGDFTVKDMKTSAEAKNQQPPTKLQVKRLKRTSQVLKNQGDTDTQSHFSGEPGVVRKEIPAVEATSNYTEDSVTESDNLQLHQ